jgi:AmiR/NasT family two-component response regulator
MVYALLIDDDTALLERVHRTARLAGLEALTAATWEEGIRLFHLHSPDLVIADSLVDDFDVMDVLTLLTDRCVAVLDVAAAGLILAVGGELRVMASSSEAMRVLEVLELQSEEGPCMDCYRTGQPIVNQELGAANDRWPRFTPEALAAGFHSAHALPMRLRGTVIGALNMFRVAEGAMEDDDIVAAQALADIATIAILQNRATLQAQVVNEQLSRALNSRIVIEQAKGVLAEWSSLDMEQAFARLRGYVRTNNLRLADVARDVISGELASDTLPPATTTRGARIA